MKFVVDVFIKKGSKTTLKTGYRLFKIGMTLVFLLMIGAAVLGILGRQIRPYYDLNVLWTGTFSTALLIVVIFLGTAIAEIEKEHIQVTFLRDKIIDIFPKFQYLIDWSIIAFAAVICYSGILAAQRQWGVGFGDLLWVNTGWLYMSIAIGFFLVGVYRLHLFTQHVGKTGGEKSSSASDESSEISLQSEDENDE